ncbi:MAG TPA: PRC-barrel domain-containing protein [Clostridiales bacterium]|nr:PRC-barrel domain-containing protein [Clostridiales bacterium]
MEINANQILGITVYSLERGERIGQVHNFYLNPKEKELIALLIGNRKIIKDESILPLKDVRGISFEAITVDSPAVLKKKNEYPEAKEFIKSPPDIVGLSILKKDGTFLGRAASFSIDTETGKITKIHLSASFIDSLRKDYTYIPAAKIEVIGSEMILVTDDATVKQERRPATQPSEKTEKREKHNKARSRFNEARPKRKEENTGCGEKIRGLSGKTFSDHGPRIIFPEIDKDHEAEKTAEK